MPAIVETPQEEKKPKVVTKRKTVDKWKKKKWYGVFAPEAFDRRELCETVAEKPELLLNRTVLVNAGDLTRQAKLNHIFLRFKIDNVQAQKAFTQIVGHEIKDSYLRRFIRRRSNKIQTVQDVETSDGKKVRIKAVAITMKQVSGPKEANIRRLMMEEVGRANKKKDFNQLSQELIFGNTASKIFKAISKVIAIKRVEITKSRIIK